jgi:hypothetical protein
MLTVADAFTVRRLPSPGCEGQQPLQEPWLIDQAFEGFLIFLAGFCDYLWR